jgi:hypothetical protein
MQEKIKLKGKEKLLQDILRVVLFSDFAVILKGMYNQSKNIDQDNILVPSFLILSIFFCSIYGINAFTSGNLVNNWADVSASQLDAFLKLSEKEKLNYTNKGFHQASLFNASVGAALPLLSGCAPKMNTSPRLEARTGTDERGRGKYGSATRSVGAAQPDSVVAADLASPVLFPIMAVASSLHDDGVGAGPGRFRIACCCGCSCGRLC